MAKSKAAAQAEQMAIALSEQTLEQLTALQEAFGKEANPSLVGLLELIVDRWHAAYCAPHSDLVENWKLRDDLSFEDIEAFAEYLAADANDHLKEGKENMWSRYGRFIRAGIKAGWVVSPVGASVDEKGKITPAIPASAAFGRALMGLFDSHYAKFLSADPN